MQLVVENLRGGYVHIVRKVMEQGDVATPRGLETREVLGASIILTNPTDSLPVGIGRGLNPAIGAIEAAQLIAGRAYPELVTRVSPAFKEFMDGGQFHGSYGPRVSAQRQHVVSKLRADPWDRRALITLWNPAVDNEPGLHDYPCTTVLQFMVRGGKLDMQVYMRSNDVWRGLAYDAFQFTQLQHSIATELQVPVGTYRHFAASLHIYQTDFEKARHMVDSFRTKDVLAVTEPRGLTVDQARRLLDGKSEPLETWTASVRWYQKQLEPFLK